MPPPPLTPPGGAAWHIVLVLLAPSLVGLGGGLAALVCGWRRQALWIAAAALLLAAALLVMSLRPDGAMRAFEAPVLQGYLRVGWIPTGAAAALLAAAAWYWRPQAWHPDSWDRTPWTWCARVALAAAMPVLCFPALWLAAEVDAEGTEPRFDHRWRTWRMIASVLASIPAILALPVWSGVAMTAACYALAAATTRGWWPIVAAASGLVLLADVVVAR